MEKMAIVKEITRIFNYNAQPMDTETLRPILQQARKALFRDPYLSGWLDGIIGVVFPPLDPPCNAMPAQADCPNSSPLATEDIDVIFTTILAGNGLTNLELQSLTKFAPDKISAILQELLGEWAIGEKEAGKWIAL